jgi:hypothetical protein
MLYFKHGKEVRRFKVGGKAYFFALFHAVLVRLEALKFEVRVGVKVLACLHRPLHVVEKASKVNPILLVVFKIVQLEEDEFTLTVDQLANQWLLLLVDSVVELG